MDITSLEPAAGVRLKLFLARQSEGRHSPRGRAKPGSAIPEQEAAVLASLAWMDHYAGNKMKGREICRLLKVGETRLSAVMSHLQAKGLVSLVDDYYRITTDGMKRLAEFADRVLGTPEDVEAELRKNALYHELVAFAGRLIDENLSRKFQAAIQRNKPKA
jgi:DNA-binding PadR family transcriptional regulator